MSHIKWRARVISAPPKIYAAIDLGTNACRLLVAVAKKNNTLHIIDSHSESICLGENLQHTGMLSPTAQNRAINSLMRIKGKIGKYQSTCVRAVATEACRQATNAQNFINRVYKETGIPLEIITANEEAQLASVGCIPLLSDHISYSVIFDIGGGSTQLILLQDAYIIESISIPYGVITLSDHINTTQLSHDDFHMHSKYIQSYIQPLVDKIAHIPHIQLLGASGTITTLTASHLKIRQYKRHIIDGNSISMDTIIKLTQHMANIDNTVRANEPCIGWERAHLMPAGCVILHAICNSWYEKNTTQKIVVADRGIREGILLGLIKKPQQNKGVSR